MQVVVLPPGSGKDGLLEAREAYPGATRAICDVPCPSCGGELRVDGYRMHMVSEDNFTRCYEWEAMTDCCDEDGWTIGVKHTSLFGFEEDRMMLEGRPRVYSSEGCVDDDMKEVN